MEDYPTRLVWITILAMKDENGFVKSSGLVLAHLARVEPVECEKALKVFLNPDPNSGITAHEGRRLEVMPGGWKVLNHEEYQFSTQAKREFWREQKRKQREADAKRKLAAKPMRKRPLSAAEQAAEKYEREGKPEEAARVMEMDEAMRAAPEASFPVGKNGGPPEEDYAPGEE
jgi:hypothetical protein